MAAYIKANKENISFMDWSQSYALLLSGFPSLF